MSESWDFICEKIDPFLGASVVSFDSRLLFVFFCRNRMKERRRELCVLWLTSRLKTPKDSCCENTVVVVQHWFPVSQITVEKFVFLWPPLIRKAMYFWYTVDSPGKSSEILFYHCRLEAPQYFGWILLYREKARLLRIVSCFSSCNDEFSLSTFVPLRSDRWVRVWRCEPRSL